MPRRLLIVNPYASRVTPTLAARVADVVRADEIVETVRRGHATELVREACGSVEAVYVFSGDGGFNEALNGVDGETPLGLVPGGGASVLPRALGIPRNPLKAAERLAHGAPRRISLGRVNGRRFGFSAGVGFDAELVRRVDALGRSRERGRAGNVAFAVAALRLLAERRVRLDPELEVRGHGRAAFALVANGDPYSYAGHFPLRIAPRARFDDGVDLVAPRRVRLRSLPRFAFYLARGGGQERAADVIYLHDVDSVEIVCDRPLPLQTDGEDLGDVESATVEAERAAVLVLT